MEQFPRHNSNVQVITAASMGADVTSTSFNVNNLDRFAVQVVWSAGAAPIGTIILQASNDGTNWTDISNAALDGSSNAGSALFNVDRPAYSSARIFYDRTSGSGTLNAIANTKI